MGPQLDKCCKGQELSFPSLTYLFMLQPPRMWMRNIDCVEACRKRRINIRGVGTSICDIGAIEFHPHDEAPVEESE